MLADPVAPANVQRDRLLIEVHARGRVHFCHDASFLRDFHPTDNSVEKFAATDGAGEWTKFEIEAKRSEFLRQLKWNLKSRSSFGQSSTHGRLCDIKNDAREHRSIEAAAFLIQPAPPQPRLG